MTTAMRTLSNAATQRHCAQRGALYQPCRRFCVLPPVRATVSLETRTTVATPETQTVETGLELGYKNDIEDVYLRGQSIGTGSFGAVHIGMHHKSGQVVAIKTLPKIRNELSRDETLSRISREMSILQRLQGCGSVIRLLDRFEDTESVHIVTEFCSGGDLYRHVDAHGALDEASLAMVAKEVLKVLKFCHDQGILHGDVKPANFCVSDTRNPAKNLKAIDFGCSQMLGSKRITKRTGTRVFMAPEIFARDYSFKVDIWAMGVTLYWLFCKRFPFFDNSVVAVACLEDIADAVNSVTVPFDFGPWEQMSAEGKDFMQRCLQRCEDKRMSADEALQHPWLQMFVNHEEDSPWY